MAEQQRRRKGSGSKSFKNPGAASRKQKRIRSHARLAKKKDRHVRESSCGKYANVAALEAHRQRVSKPSHTATGKD